MAQKKISRRIKGKFSDILLSVSGKYIIPVSRKLMIRAGFLGCLLLMFYFTFDFFFQGQSFIASGPVSSNHANFENDCAACHDLGNAVVDENCSRCHEKTSEFAVYDFKTHYLYRSGDYSRVAKVATEHEADEMNCRSCHVEHNGRDGAITQVSDSKCLKCHAYGSFNKNHPEFEFANPDSFRSSSDDTTLVMTHIRHTFFLLQKISGISNLDSSAMATLSEESEHFFEQACLSCHIPDPDGKNFADLNFETNCSDCHLGGDRAIEGLTAKASINSSEPGVESLKMIQKRGGPGVSWAYTVNPNLISDEDGEVSKSPVYHEDPWILENLKQIRKRLFPQSRDGNLYDLLKTSGLGGKQQVDTLYNEAIQTLQEYTNELQARPELRDDLTKMNSLLRIAKKIIARPTTSKTKSTFDFPFEKNTSPLNQQQKEGFLQLAFDLTSSDGPECQKCHILENASIRRVQANQDELFRAEFDHRAHILETNCTECHHEINIDPATLLKAKSSLTTSKQEFPFDKAATHNLPQIASCQDCHAAQKVSNTCVTCHKFHPNKKNRSSLQLFSRQPDIDNSVSMK